ncbi:MAG: magnesium transporter [Oscillospiraceae bacterium]|jgi:magnesium transporter|nr:magnesium transporter [Oscillospiraceae bacterium]
MTKELLATNDIAAIKSALAEMNPVDVAEEFDELDDSASVVKLFRVLPKDTAADVFAYLSHDRQQEIVSAIKDKEVARIIDDLFLDDAVDFIEEMPAFVVKRVLSNLPPEKRDAINHFLKYPENSAGSIMTIEYIDLKAHLTVAETFEKIRAEGVDKETIYTCYVIDAARRLVGTVSVRTLLLSLPTDTIGEIMERSIISATTYDDKETLANDFRRYGLLAMPVVDNEKRLVGIVTFDDVMTVQEEEATEDFELMAAMSPSDEPYLKTSVLKLTQNRILWLMLLMLSATVTGSIISGFEDALAVMPALVAFIPMLMDTGGNAGSQSSTLIIRGMALDEIRLSDVFRVLWKEVRVSLLCGGALAAVNFLRIVLLQHEPTVALAVSLAILATVVLAKTVGCLLPMGAKLLRLDPAVMASPVITTVVDAGALLLFFAFAKGLLGV